MDRRAPQTPAPREIMFCHQCENEWYRDEHGITCPECQSDFCEAIESHNDPRTEGLEQLRNHNPWEAPDPDEDDIGDYPWQASSPGEVPGVSGYGARAEQPAQGGGLGFTGLIGSAISGLIGGILQPPDYNTTHQRQRASDEIDRDGDEDIREVHHTTVTPGGTTVTRHMNSNGFSFTMTSSRSTGLHPRNTGGAQPFQRQPETIDELMYQMLSNIGAVGPGMGQDRFPPGAHFATNMHGPPGLMQLLGGPLSGILGDAVYTQEGLDRVISQLMEQHSTGNAPGPASEAAISNLPQRTITEKDFGDDGTAECSICMEAVELGTKVTELPCHHWFHAECVGAWLGEHDTCPHCRKGIMPEADANAASPRNPQQAPLNDSSASGVPGSFPYSRAGASSARPSGRPSSTRAASGAGVFDRMREAFGGGGGSAEEQRRR